MTEPHSLRLVSDETGGSTLLLGGQPQSYVDVTDPARLEFQYVQHFAAAIDALMPDGPLRVTHLGGGGLTLARWVSHTRPGSPQIVLEPNAQLTELVRTQLPLPRGHRIRVRTETAEAGLTSLASESAQVMILDAFESTRVPASVVTEEFFASAARVLAADGLFLANVADYSNLKWAARVGAGLQSAFGETAVIAANDVAKGRRFGNLVLIGARRPIDVDGITKLLNRSPFMASVMDHSWLSRRSGSHPRPFTAADAEPSPQSPDAMVFVRS